MKCVGCGKEINVKKIEVNNFTADWYGIYRGDKLIRVICHTCISDKQKKELYYKKEA